MPKLTNGVPKYRHHKQSGQAIVTLNGRDFLLGPWNTKASRTKYNRLVAEWLAGNRHPLATDQNGLTIGELVSRYVRFAKRYYVKDGLPTSELLCIKAAMRPLLKLYADELASNFGPVALRAVRDEMLTLDWSRQTINGHIDRIRRMFRWATSEELLPVEAFQRLATLTALSKGRTEAREMEPVLPVGDDVVAATLPFLGEVVSAMVQLQRLTAMRPGEVCQLRPCDLDRTESIWTYRPESHKTQHRNKTRIIYIGPQAQSVLLRYLARDASMFCFRPIDSEAKRRAAASEARATPLSCGNRRGTNKKKKPKFQPGERYDVGSYCRAVERACEKAYPLPALLARKPGELMRAWRKRLTGVSLNIVIEHRARHHWTPNMLRHSAATEVRKAFGLEAAQTILGHANASTSEIYAQRDEALGIEVARAIG